MVNDNMLYEFEWQNKYDKANNYVGVEFKTNYLPLHLYMLNARDTKTNGYTEIQAFVNALLSCCYGDSFDLYGFIQVYFRITTPDSVSVEISLNHNTFGFNLQHDNITRAYTTMLYNAKLKLLSIIHDRQSCNIFTKQNISINASNVTFYPAIKTSPKIKNVIFNNPATIVFWTDGTKTVVKCQGDDVYNKEKGLAMAYIKKCNGNNGNYNNIFREWIKE